MTPQASDVGWWASNDTQAKHLGDSFLYAGNFDNEVFASAIRFDLQGMPRGAPIREAVLQLTGLRDDRLAAEAGDVPWTVQFVNPQALPELARTDFQALYNAPAEVVLFPTLNAADLKTLKVNSLALDASAREWLAQQLVNGATSVIARIVGPTGGTPTLFAWDSGSGPATSGAGPRLEINLGPAPSTPPPLLTRPFIVATLTPTPANVLTAAADAWTATAALRAGTMTPSALVAVTPTPGNPLLVITSTPIPENPATATAEAAYATAVAVTTGTFTPMPTNAVTPVVVLPTPMPENVMTVAALVVAQTSRPKLVTTGTPLPYNYVVATTTPKRVLVTSTPRPGNAATAWAQAAYATAVAVTTGTFTPMPSFAMTPTPPPPTPLVLYLDQVPTPDVTLTPSPGTQLPRELIGKVLFMSDRDGAARLFALDPASGRLAYVTQEWPYYLAQKGEVQSSDDRYTLSVQDRSDTESRTPGVFIRDNQYGRATLLAPGKGWSYDPVFSPRDNRIAFVSAESGNDEIYSINPDGSDMRRLTSNTWEWDKHPSWSPDGSQIVFWSNRDTGRRQLWVMNADGTNPHLLLKSTFNDWDPVWGK